MLQLHKRLTEERKLSSSSADAYIRALSVLNGKKPFTSLAFVKKTADIDKLIESYAFNTKKSFYSALVSVLSLFKDTRGFKKVYETFREKLGEFIEDAKKIDPAEKTPTQKENWMSWEEVQAVKKALADKLGKKPDFDDLLHHTLLSIYTDIAPRRNQDYLDCWVVGVKKNTDLTTLPDDKNYLVLESKKPRVLLFNKYKTAKKYGRQIVDVSPELAESLTLYLKHHPLRAEKEYPLLVDKDGKPFTAVNSITRILNKIFGKKVGASMLRHSYLSSKYGDILEEQKEDAYDMGHSVNQARDYIKREDSQSVTIPTVES